MHNAGLNDSFGENRVIASGNPSGISTTAIRMSWVPRLRISFITRSQNLAPSPYSIYISSTSLWPDACTPITRYTALFFTSPSSRIVTRIKERQKGYVFSIDRSPHSRCWIATWKRCTLAE